MITEVDKEHMEMLGRAFHKILRYVMSGQALNMKGDFSALSSLEIAVISQVYRNQDLILREIVEKLNIPNSTLTSAVNRLEKGGYLKRVISRRDKRSYGLELTDKGFAAMKEHLRVEQIFFKKILSSLSDDDERGIFLKMLTRISDKLTDKEIVT